MLVSDAFSEAQASSPASSKAPPPRASLARQSHHAWYGRFTCLSAVNLLAYGILRGIPAHSDTRESVTREAGGESDRYADSEEPPIPKLQADRILEIRRLDVLGHRRRRGAICHPCCQSTCPKENAALRQRVCVRQTVRLTQIDMIKSRLLGLGNSRYPLGDGRLSWLTGAATNRRGLSSCARCRANLPPSVTHMIVSVTAASPKRATNAARSALERRCFPGRDECIMFSPALVLSRSAFTSRRTLRALSPLCLGRPWFALPLLQMSGSPIASGGIPR